MMMYPILATTLNCIVIALFFGSKNPIAYIGIQSYGITVYGDAVDLAITLLCRVLGGVSSLFFLSLTTPMMDTWIVLRKMGIPSILVEMSMLMYRYLFVFLEYASRMRLAQELRLGYSTLRRSFRSISLVATNLFIVTLQQGERTFTAMTARGYDGNIRMLTDIPKPSLSSIAGIVAFDILMAFMIFLTQHVTVV
jgi:cobalt/nickel transport system permease protein